MAEDDMTGTETTDDETTALNQHEVRFGRLPGKKKPVGGTPAHAAAAAAMESDPPDMTRKTSRHPVTGQFISDDLVSMMAARDSFAAGHAAPVAESYSTAARPGPDPDVQPVHCEWSYNGLPMSPGGGFPAGDTEVLTQKFPDHSPLSAHQPQVSIDVVNFASPVNQAMATQLRVPVDSSAGSSAGSPSKILPASVSPASPRPMGAFRAVQLGGTGSAPMMNYTGRAPGE